MEMQDILFLKIREC